ncbi:protein NRT1/ PTR FAMILY 1.1-like [Chenopodium quinoa]|uniref:protein NRT1/ PTR FAMILY 1.1-like n=1 Tax=Chenopodium quinoa TaxID=63459 RepID=UPI000B76E2C8|nr:protein NRT1/ PTR FAMILY 1.1-like [Chenopodium quinoa]
MALEESRVELTEEKMEKMAILPDNNNNSDQHETTPKSKKKGGIITMPFIIVNEAFEKVASYGLLPNMIFYLMNVYHLEAAKGVIVLSLWSGISNALAIVGGFLSDSYFGRFRVIAFGTFCSLLGTSLLWLTSVVPALKPAPCAKSSSESCSSATPIQFLVLFGSFGLISIGAGCVRPCSLAFGADQVSNKDNPNNERVLDSFFNWYYASTGLATIIALTVIVFIQDKFGWPIGFGVPVCLMVLSLVAFFFGSPLYVHVKVKDSLFIGMFCS